jgi:hypothetical protein
MRALVTLALAMAVVASDPSWAHGYYRPGWGGYYGPRVGIYVGSPWYWGPSWYWGAPYYWGPSWYGGAPWYGYGSPYAWGYPAWRYDAGVGYSGSPPYVERTAPSQRGSWYYCIDPPGYYPHVSLCNRPWVEVAPFTVERDTRKPRTSP